MVTAAWSTVRPLLTLGLAGMGGVPQRAAVARCAMPCEPFGRASVVAAIDVLKAGGMILVTDDESRENEGDLIMAGEHANAENTGFIIRHSSGVICIAVPGERLDELQLPPMCVTNEDPKGTAFTVSVDYKVGTSTGISGADRAATFRALADPTSKPEDFQRPGHVFPLRPRPGGVRERDGHTEAALDFVRLAGLQPAGILAEVCNDDGTMARVKDLIPFCEKHGLVLTSIADLSARSPSACPLSHAPDRVRARALPWPRLPWQQLSVPLTRAHAFVVHDSRLHQRGRGAHAAAQRPRCGGAHELRGAGREQQRGSGSGVSAACEEQSRVSCQRDDAPPGLRALEGCVIVT